MISGVIIFSSIQFLSKKIIKSNLKKKLKPVQTDWFRFGFLGQKPIQTGLARFFSGMARFFPVGFGSVFSVLNL
jgi:hypothetical protein